VSPLTPDGGPLGFFVFFFSLLVSAFQGIFADKEHGTKCASLSLLIHTNKSKTKAQEKQKRLRQRQGVILTVDEVTPRFKEGLEEVP
jgi:hypothetical protein